MRARTARAQLVLVALIAGPAALSLACGTRQCNATNCQDGCCDAEGMCWVGGSDDYCGQGGRACSQCDRSLKECVSGQCLARCRPATCADGCCAGAYCRTYSSDSQCGKGGVACVDCTPSGMGCKEDGTACCGQTGNSCSSDANCCDSTYSLSNFYCDGRDGGSTCQACKSYARCAESRECCPGYTCQYDSFSGYTRCK